jgi:tetratricopeptide (TPR) repeat protein
MLTTIVGLLNDKAIELNPDFAYAYNNRGLTYYDLMMYNEAIEDYYKAIELNPDFDIAHANLGDALFMKEDYDNAEEEYREALKSILIYSSFRSILYILLGYIPMLSGFFQNPLKTNEDIDYAHNGLGLVLSKRKAYKDAIAEFKKALKLNKDPDFYNNLGCAYAEYGKGSAIAPFILLCAHHKLTKATQEKNTYIKAYKNLTHVGDLLKDEWTILLLRIFIISFVFALSLFALSINLFELSKDNWLGIILILTGVATLGIVLFSLDFTKIKIKSLKIAGVEAKFNYEKPKAGEKVLQFAKPK